MEDKLLEIINYYGLRKQLKYIHSEYYELDEAILDYESSGWDFSDEDCKDVEKEYREHIAEEIADIMVMLKQFQYYYDIDDSYIKDMMNTKIIRQMNRVSLEKATSKQVNMLGGIQNV